MSHCPLGNAVRVDDLGRLLGEDANQQRAGVMGWMMNDDTVIFNDKQSVQSTVSTSYLASYFEVVVA